MFRGVLVCVKSAPPAILNCTGLNSLGQTRRPVDQVGRWSHERIDRVMIDRGTREQSSLWPVDGDRPGFPCNRPGWIDRQTRE